MPYTVQDRAKHIEESVSHRAYYKSLPEQLEALHGNLAKHEPGAGSIRQRTEWNIHKIGEYVKVCFDPCHDARKNPEVHKRSSQAGAVSRRAACSCADALKCRVV